MPDVLWVFTNDWLPAPADQRWAGFSTIGCGCNCRPVTLPLSFLSPSPTTVAPLLTGNWKEVTAVASFESCHSLIQVAAALAVLQTRLHIISGRGSKKDYLMLNVNNTGRSSVRNRHAWGSFVLSYIVYNHNDIWHAHQKVPDMTQWILFFFLYTVP